MLFVCSFVYLFVCLYLHNVAINTLTLYAIFYFFPMSYKYILTFQSFKILVLKKYMTFSSCYIALH